MADEFGSIMVDAALDERLHRDGFVVVPSLVSRDTCTWLAERYRGAEPAERNPRGHPETYAEFTMLHSGEQFRREVFSDVVSTIGARVEPLLDDYVPLIANYIRKAPHQGHVPIHQNWSMVDERRFTTLSTWVPLSDVDATNGALVVVRGSHRMFRYLRGSWGDTKFDNCGSEILERYGEVLELSAGDAVVFDDSLVHSSTPNLGAAERLSIQLILRPRAAAPIYFLQDDPEVMEARVLAVDPGYFWDFWDWRGDPDPARVLGSVRIEKPRYTFDEWNAIYLGTSDPEPTLPAGVELPAEWCAAAPDSTP